jgi:hypothetical protein
MGNGGTTQKMLRPAGTALERKTTFLMFERNKGLGLCFFMWEMHEGQRMMYFVQGIETVGQ